MAACNSPLLLVVGTILSFADPITDILTLVELYRADHKTLFYLGLSFVLLPCLVFPWLYFRVRNEKLSQYSGTRKCWQTLVCGFHPFSPAFARLERLLELWLGDEQVDEDLPLYISMAVAFESVLESAPQFIFQLYVIIELDQEVKLIQKISLPISFVSLVWALTILDCTLSHGNLNIKRRVGFFVANLFGLGIRLAVILFFTVRFKWWIVVAILSHNFVMLTADIILCCANSGKFEFGIAVLIFFLCWIKEEVSLLHFARVFEDAKLKKRQTISFVWFVLENTIMTLVCIWHRLGAEDGPVMGLVAIIFWLFLAFAFVTHLRALIIFSCLYEN